MRGRRGVLSDYIAAIRGTMAMRRSRGQMRIELAFAGAAMVVALVGFYSVFAQSEEAESADRERSATGLLGDDPDRGLIIGDGDGFVVVEGEGGTTAGPGTGGVDGVDGAVTGGSGTTGSGGVPGGTSGAGVLPSGGAPGDGSAGAPGAGGGEGEGGTETTVPGSSTSDPGTTPTDPGSSTSTTEPDDPGTTPTTAPPVSDNLVTAILDLLGG